MAYINGTMTMFDPTIYLKIKLILPPWKETMKRTFDLLISSQYLAWIDNMRRQNKLAYAPLQSITTSVLRLNAKIIFAVHSSVCTEIVITIYKAGQY